MYFFRRLSVSSALFLALFVMPSAQAFVVKQIQFVGLQRISTASASSYLPLKVGQNLKSSEVPKLIQSLYKTGFFSEIQLSRRNNTLVVSVKEHPTIGSFSFSGNSEITNKQIKPVLKALTLQAGDVYYPYKLNQLVVSLEQQYRDMGFYAATVKSSIKTVSRNRVAVDVKVVEGQPATVNKIEFIGNTNFSTRKLVSQMSMTTWTLYSFITHSDRYSPRKLSSDLQAISRFYADHGYLSFRVLDKTVTPLAKNKRKVNIAIEVSEGSVFKVGKVGAQGKSGNNPEVLKRITLKKGEVFSQKDVDGVTQSISSYFSNQGYATPQVMVSTQLNHKNNTVDVQFNVDNKNRVYVRRVNFVGNDGSQDFALRSVVAQMEGSVYSQAQIDRSKQKISLLPYFQLLGVQVVPVPNKSGEVDLNFHVKKLQAGSFTIKGGYGDMQKFYYQVNHRHYQCNQYLLLNYKKALMPQNTAHPS